MNGKVTAIKPGTTTITVTTKDGEYKATCDVTVLNNVIPINKIELLNASNVNLVISECVSILPDDIDAKTHQLNVKIYPEEATNKNVTWKSSDESVVTVSQDGKVTAIAPGKATITVQSNDNAGAIDECDVTILGFEMSNDDLELAVNDTHKMYVKVLPESESESSSINFIWSSNNKRMATVDNVGNVTAIGEGSVEITAATLVQKAGDIYNIEITWYIHTKKIPVSFISLKNNKIILYPGETDKFVVIFEPENATNKEISWSSIDESVATVDQDGTIKAIGEGIATITITSKDNESAKTYGIVEVR